MNITYQFSGRAIAGADSVAGTIAIHAGRDDLGDDGMVIMSRSLYEVVADVLGDDWDEDSIDAAIANCAIYDEDFKAVVDE